MFLDAPSFLLGINKNLIKVKQDDYSSIIAYALSSNLYIEGLIKINYIDISNKMINSSTHEKIS